MVLAMINPVQNFKDAGQIRRQAARFRVYRCEEGKEPVEMRVGNGLKALKWVGTHGEQEIGVVELF